MIVGLVAAPGPTEELARVLASRLPSLLGERFATTSWSVVVLRRHPRTEAKSLERVRRRLDALHDRISG